MSTQIKNNKLKHICAWKSSRKVRYTLVGKGCYKKQMSYCNDKDKFLTNSKECWLITGANIWNKNAIYNLTNNSLSFQELENYNFPI